MSQAQWDKYAAEHVTRPHRKIDPAMHQPRKISSGIQFGIGRDDAESIYEEIAAAMGKLPLLLDKYEVTERDRETLAQIWVHALNPPALPRNVST